MKARFSLIVFHVITAAVLLSEQAYSQSYQLRPRITGLVERLRKDHVLHFGAPVGYAGVLETKNEYFKLYKRLSNSATDEELVALTKDTSKTIILYSFAILRSRGFEDLKNIFLDHVSDTSTVWTTGGCTGVIWKTNSLMLHYLRLDQQPHGKEYLSKAEYEKYFAQIGY